MKIDVFEPNSFTREMVIDIPWEELEDDFNQSLRKFSKRVKLPGFRPGKVPRKVLLAQFQPNIEADFIEDSFQKYYTRALDQKGLTPVNVGEISDLDFHYQGHFTFKVTFEVEPEIQLPPLKKNSLKVQKTIYVTDDEDVEKAIEEMRLANVEIKTVEEGARSGDFVLCDLQKVDGSGVPIIGEKWEQRYLKLGDGIITGENEQKLLGVKPGDKVRIMIPDEDSENDSIFEVTVTRVEEHKLPEVNMDFIKLVDPDAEDEASWRAGIRDRINRNYEHRAQEIFERELSDTLIEKIDPEYPPSMADVYLDHLVEDVKRSNNGAEIDEEQVRRMYRPVAVRNLKWYLVRKAIIRDQGLEVSEEEVLQEIERLKERSPEHAGEIEKYYRKPSNRSRIKDDLLEKKILDYIHSFAKVKEVKVKTKDLRQNSEQEAISNE